MPATLLIRKSTESKSIDVGCANVLRRRLVAVRLPLVLGNAGVWAAKSAAVRSRICARACRTGREERGAAKVLTMDEARRWRATSAGCPRC